MLAHVTNRARAARGFATVDRGIVLLEAKATALLDLADHALHEAWIGCGDVLVAPLSDKEAKLVRKRLDGEAEAAARNQADALAQLPAAPPASL